MQVSINEQALDAQCKIMDVRRGITPPRELSTLTIAGRSGQYVFPPRHDARLIEIEIMIINDVRSKVDDIAKIVTTDEPVPIVFSDEPHKTYQAILVGDPQLATLRHTGRAILTFLVPDAYAEGQARFIELDSDGYAGFTYGGNAPTAPIITAEFTEPAQTFAIQNGRGEYIMVGDAHPLDGPTAKSRELEFFDHMQSLTPWSTDLGTFTPDRGMSNGTMAVAGGEHFYASNYGVPSNPTSFWYGASRRRVLSKAITDFEINLDVHMIKKLAQAGRIEVYMLAADGSTIGKIAFVTHTGRPYFHAEGRLGHWQGGRYFHGGESDENARFAGTDLRGSMKIKRVGTRWEILMSRVIGGVRQDYRVAHYNDFDGLYSKDLYQVAIHIGKPTNSAPPDRAYLSGLSVYEHNNETEMTIFDDGDVLEIDCEQGLIFRNGALLMTELYPGSTFFDIKDAVEQFAAEPARADVRVDWRERWL